MKNKQEILIKNLKPTLKVKAARKASTLSQLVSLVNNSIFKDKIVKKIIVKLKEFDKLILKYENNSINKKEMME